MSLTLTTFLRHEIAFIFGQLLSPHSVPSLLEVLQNTRESDMVRHEAAEALGGIATPEVLPHLRVWMTKDDAPRVVRESCQIAIDMWEVGCIQIFSNSFFDKEHSISSTRIQMNFNTLTVWVGQHQLQWLVHNSIKPLMAYP